MKSEPIPLFSLSRVISNSREQRERRKRDDGNGWVRDISLPLTPSFPVTHFPICLSPPSLANGQVLVNTVKGERFLSHIIPSLLPLGFISWQLLHGFLEVTKGPEERDGGSLVLPLPTVTPSILEGLDHRSTSSTLYILFTREQRER